jgi:hypothetical protein
LKFALGLVLVTSPFMKTNILLAAFLFTVVAQAQLQNQFQNQFESQCQFRVNPHSFACNDETYFGRHFPISSINQQRFQGAWRLLTFAGPEGNQSFDLSMTTNPNNPRIPEGVRNRADHSFAGPLDWFGDDIEMRSWKDADSGSPILFNGISSLDQWTVQVKLQGLDTVDALQCRIFIRSQTDHLLCRWFESRQNSRQNSDQGQWIFRGYLGFLL